MIIYVVWEACDDQDNRTEAELWCGDCGPTEHFLATETSTDMVTYTCPQCHQETTEQRWCDNKEYFPPGENNLHKVMEGLSVRRELIELLQSKIVLLEDEKVVLQRCLREEQDLQKLLESLIEREGLTQSV